MTDGRIDIHKVRVKLTRTGWGKFIVPIPHELPTGKPLMLHVDAPAGTATWTLDAANPKTGTAQTVLGQSSGSSRPSEKAPMAESPQQGAPEAGGPRARIWGLYACLRCGSKFSAPIRPLGPMHECGRLVTPDGPVIYNGIGQLIGINEDHRA